MVGSNSKHTRVHQPYEAAWLHENGLAVNMESRRFHVDRVFILMPDLGKLQGDLGSKQQEVRKRQVAFIQSDCFISLDWSGFERPSPGTGAYKTHRIVMKKQRGARQSW